MLRNVRNWVQGMFSPKTAPTPEQTDKTAATARQDRATSISNLQRDVRRIQQEIKDASDTLAGGLPADERTAATRQLAALERELEQKQRERDKLQGRI